MTPTARLRFATACFGLISLVALTVAVRSGSATTLDLRVSAALAPFRTHGLLAAFLWLTLLGTEAAVFGMSAATGALLWSEGRIRALLAIWTTVLGAEATTWIIKFGIDRARPEFLPDVATALSPSFPSAHSTGTTAFVGIMACLVMRSPRSQPRRPAILLTALALVTTIGFSRVFLSVHYLTDVLAGVAVGGIWVSVGSALLDPPTAGPASGRDPRSA